MLEQMRRFAITTLALGLLWATPAATCWEGEIVRPRAKPKPRRIRTSKPAARRPITTRTERLPGGATIEMVLVSAGTFTMGSTDGGDEHPAHRVTISQPFYIGKYEVTQAQWAAVMGTNPSYFRGDTLPVEQVSWEDVQAFLRRLNSVSAGRYRLPTEAEWEYACRAGTTRDSGQDLDAMAWFGNNSGDWRQNADDIWSSDQRNYNQRILDNRCRTHPVGTKRPNTWGLHDMQGNVREWCQDWYGPYSSGPRTNPSGAMVGSYRVRRGGCWWSSTASDCDSAGRSGYAPGYRVNTLGLRLVRTAR